MKLTQEEIDSLVTTGWVAGMPAGGKCVGFTDYDGRYFPVYTLGAFFYAGIDCEFYTYNGSDFYLRFFF